MEKICVFCGKRPQTKTNEHVLPKWLIRLTGDPKRKVSFGLDIQGSDAKARIFSFDAFKFPACNNCNELFSQVEDRAKTIIEKMLDSDPLTRDDLIRLLDWFDKIRVGAWLGSLYLNKIYSMVDPVYQIHKRIGAFDRVLGIFYNQDTTQRLNTIGTESPVFSFTPSCFGLIINKIYFFNASYPFLFARRIGFPYPSKTWFRPDTRMHESELEIGRERVMRPLLRKPFTVRGTYLFQPMFRYQTSPEYRSYYDRPYVRARCHDWENGVGLVFLQSDNDLVPYPDQPGKDWIPAIKYSPEVIKKSVTLQVFRSQIMIHDELCPSAELLNVEQRKYLRNFVAAGRRFNEKVIQFIETSPDF
jgi:hypothetical protein